MATIKASLKVASLQDPGDRYTLLECLGTGVCSTVHVAIDTQASDKKVAIKIQRTTADNMRFIHEEYRVLRDYSDHPNLPDFYGVYRKKSDADEIWFVMEYCEGGPIVDLVVGLRAANRNMSEEHIAYILKEIIKALNHLHDNHILHRDIRGSNILLTKDGEIRLVDFGLSRELDSPMGKRRTSIGSPCWMSPEMVTSEHSQSDGTGYGSRADVWAVGITAIELGDGEPPFQDFHPTRAMFQIVRNPPPGLQRPANWSQNYNDFVSECLEKNPEHRPFMMELLEHPFFEKLPENDYYLTQELKQLAVDFSANGRTQRNEEWIIEKNFLRKKLNVKAEKMHVEDLAALEDITEDIIISELSERIKEGHFHTFVGDILLVLNPNERQDIYGLEHHAKYKFKSRSDNAPHIYAVADSAYQAVLHHDETQHVILSGESLSGKTTSLIHLVEHFSYLGQSPNNNSGQQVQRGLAIIHALGNASTPVNSNSTRCVLQAQITFGGAGKISGAIFWLYQLEKSRVSTTDMMQANFHLFYYFYDAMEIEKTLEKYELERGRMYRYLRIPEIKCSSWPRDQPKQNLKQFLIIQQNLYDLGFEASQVEFVWSVLAAILNLGEIQFKDTDTSIAAIENIDVAIKVAKLLHVDEKKFVWALTNYCSIRDGTATRTKNTSEEARDVRDVLANNIYSRLVDWVVYTINQKLLFGRAIFGDKFMINIFDLFGFECFPRNHIEQLLVNTLNEQLQYHYTQKLFAWEMQEQQEEHIPGVPLTYFDNRPILEEILAKPTGLLAHIDEATKNNLNSQYIIDTVRKSSKTPHVRVSSGNEFAVSHYTGTLLYDARELADRNQDFLPPEMTEVLRASSDPIVRLFFTRALDRTGNLTLDTADDDVTMARMTRQTRKGTSRDAKLLKKVNCNTQAASYSQTRQMRTTIAVFRATCLEILRSLSASADSGTHFVRCIRADLSGCARGFQREIVKHQLRAMTVLDTAKARQKGYPHRVPFNEFLRRYKFLGFDFDENVEITKENCRLLLIRLKMEGWAIGKSKVFLKYYNEEYLARLYEIQVKKIVKVQCMMRAFLAKRNLAIKVKKCKKDAKTKLQSTAEVPDKDAAAVVIQKAFRGYAVRKTYGPLINSQSGKLDEVTAEFIRPYAQKWKNKSMFQVILQYRAAKFQDVVHFAQQVHIYNQAVMAAIETTKTCVPLDKVNTKSHISEFLREKKLAVWKLPFRFDKLAYYDTSFMCDPYASGGSLPTDEDHEAWDSPLRWRVSIAGQVAHSLNVQEPTASSFGYCRVHKDPPTVVHTPFCRDPSVPINQLHLGNDGNRQIFGSPLKSTYTSHGSRVMNRPSSQIDHELDFNRSPNSTPTKYVASKPRNSTVNPIKELELIGRKNTINNITDDDPPFNFQSMLRKTNYNRESMKRNRSDEIVVPISQYRPRSAPKEIDDMNYEEEMFDSPEKCVNTVVYNINNNSLNDNRITNGNISSEVITATELAPGIMIEGIVTDL